MSQQPEKKEQPSTYVVQDRENLDELTRLTLQDHLLTTSLGGVLAEQPEPAAFRRVLDIGCGTGGWAIETAQAYPDMALVIGIDISQRMITYARQQAESQKVADRVEFHVMDALRMLEFPDRFFDLVNMRLGGSWLRTWDWAKLLSEMLRITRSKGIMRITEQEFFHQNSSAAMTQINTMLLQAFYRAGYLFEQETTGLTGHLFPLLKQHGVQQLQAQEYTLEYHAGTAQGEEYIKDALAGARIVRPFLQKWGSLPDDYSELCQQAEREAHQPDFHSQWKLLCVWGTKL